jgi:hypothetical protein
MIHGQGRSGTYAQFIFASKIVLSRY